jgi:hypothetical protein
MLTREPDSIDLFAAETGAALAETLFLVGDRLAPEVQRRIRHEVERRIFKPYLAYARAHWWYKGALNWNGVCNGSIALAFLRLENDLDTLAEGLALALEGFEAFIATGFEADGGSIEGVGYWNYGLLYYVTVAELLREKTGGELDLLANPRLRAIAAYPPGMALDAPNKFINFGDSTETQTLSAGIINRLAERTGVDELRTLLVPLDEASHVSEAGHTAAEFSKRFGYNFYSKLPIIMRYTAWWDCTKPIPTLQLRDFVLPDTGIVKFVTTTDRGQTVQLVAKAGHNDGHHSHTDVGTFIMNVNGESLIPDAGRGLYSKEYFRQHRYENIFNNSYSHSVPRIAGQLQKPGPEFGGTQQYHGTINDYGPHGDSKIAEIDFQAAYDVPDLRRARRTLELNTATGAVLLTDEFELSAPLAIEEAIITWSAVEAQGNTACIRGEHASVNLTIVEPSEAVFAVETLDDACRENLLDGTLSRLSISLPTGTTRFQLRCIPQ